MQKDYLGNEDGAAYHEHPSASNKPEADRQGVPVKVSCYNGKEKWTDRINTPTWHGLLGGSCSHQPALDILSRLFAA